jgi:hypothetical protein
MSRRSYDVFGVLKLPFTSYLLDCPGGKAVFRAVGSFDHGKPFFDLFHIFFI